MKLLEGLFSGPSDLHSKLRSDSAELIKALNANDEIMVRNWLFNFAVTAYHLKEWVAATGKAQESAADALYNQSQVLPICRDIANSAKHCVLDLEKGPNKKFPPVTEEIAMSASPSTQISLTANPQPTKVQVTRKTTWKLKIGLKSGQRLECEEFVSQVLKEWEQFFDAQEPNPKSA